MVDVERRAQAAREIELNPGKYRRKKLKDIFRQVVTVGMTPQEARLAGGDCSYRVVPDRDRWPLGISPLIVMEAQSCEPDNSEIVLYFLNDTQFSLSKRFKVEFCRGRVVNVQAES